MNVQKLIEGNTIISSLAALTDADKRYLARETKAGRVYRRKGITFQNVTYWVRAESADVLDSREYADFAKITLAGVLDAANRLAA